MPSLAGERDTDLSRGGFDVAGFFCTRLIVRNTVWHIEGIGVAMPSGFDTAQICSSQATALRAAGYDFVGRDLSKSTES